MWLFAGGLKIIGRFFCESEVWDGNPGLNWGRISGGDREELLHNLSESALFRQRIQLLRREIVRWDLCLLSPLNPISLIPLIL